MVYEHKTKDTQGQRLSNITSLSLFASLMFAWRLDHFHLLTQSPTTDRDRVVEVS